MSPSSTLDAPATLELADAAAALTTAVSKCEALHLEWREGSALLLALSAS
jgi:hypothetical protein